MLSVVCIERVLFVTVYRSKGTNSHFITKSSELVTASRQRPHLVPADGHLLFGVPAYSTLWSLRVHCAAYMHTLTVANFVVGSYFPVWDIFIFRAAVGIGF